MLAVASTCSGSLASNAQLVFYQLFMADMFEKDAQVDAPETAHHARGLSAGFLAASTILDSAYGGGKNSAGSGKTNSSDTQLLRGVADSAPMAALTCILFHNVKDDLASTPQSSLSLTDDGDQDREPHAKRRWLLGRENFLRGLLKSAGRRHALGVDSSGCLRSSGGNSRAKRQSAFADWEVIDDEYPPISETSSSTAVQSTRNSKSAQKRGLKPCIDDFRDALRPMIVYFAIMDQLSSEFVVNMDDSKVEESSRRIVENIESCQRAKSIQELLAVARVTIDHDEIIGELQKGMIAVQMQD